MWASSSFVPLHRCGVAAYLLVVLVDNLVDLGVKVLRHKSQGQIRM